MKKLLRCLLSGVIALTMLCSLFNVVSAEETESWTAFDIDITLKSGTPSANQNVIFDISITNTTDNQLTTDFIDSIFDKTWINDGVDDHDDWGTLKDKNGNVISNTQGIVFASKETKIYTLEGTLPATWIDYNKDNPLESSFITIHVMSGNMHGQNGYPADGAILMGEHYNAFKIDITHKSGTIGINQNVVFDVSVTNSSKKELTVNNINSHLYPKVDNNGDGESYDWGTLKDSKGNVVNASSKIVFAAGETQYFTLEGQLPSNWIGYQEDNEYNSFIGVKVDASDYFGHYYYAFEDGSIDDFDDVTNSNETQYDSNIEYPEEIDEKFQNELFEYLSQKGLLDQYSVQDLKDADCGLYIGYDEKWNQLSNDEVKELEKHTPNQPAYKVQIEFSIQSENGDIYIPVNEFHKKIKITVNIPEELLKAGRTFSIVREHDGKYDVLEDIDSNDKTVTFLSDKFSDFYLVYNDVNVTNPTSSGSHNKASSSVKTGDDTNDVIYGFICVSTLLAFYLLKKRQPFIK